MHIYATNRNRNYMKMNENASIRTKIAFDCYICPLLSCQYVKERLFCIFSPLVIFYISLFTFHFSLFMPLYI